jgi:hypothetical protein
LDFEIGLWACWAFGQWVKAFFFLFFIFFFAPLSLFCAPKVHELTKLPLLISAKLLTC